MTLLLVCGSLNYDITMYVDRFAPPKSIVKKIRRYLGGSGGNAAVAASKILGRGKVVFLGAVGNDEIGMKHINSLKGEGIDTSLIKVVNNYESGQAFVAVNTEGESAIYSYYGANLALSAGDIDEKVMRYLRMVKGVLIMNPPISVAHELMRRCRLLGGKTIFWDPGAYSTKGLNALTPLIRLADYMIPNESELLTLTKTSGISSAVKELWRINPRIKVIVKMGEKGSVLYDPLSRSVISVPSIPLKSLGFKIISTVGCGDAYVGVFSAARLLGMDDLNSMKLATCAAALNVTCEGPRCIPDKDELLKIFYKCNKLLHEHVQQA